LSFTEFIVEDCQKAVKKLPGVTDVSIEVTAETPSKKAYQTAMAFLGKKYYCCF